MKKSTPLKEMILRSYPIFQKGTRPLVSSASFNENDEVDKYKARLVAKGYKQQYGVDYIEVFSQLHYTTPLDWWWRW